MSKRNVKSIHEKDFDNSKKIKLAPKKKDSNINFDTINELILKKYPGLDTKNLELTKFLTIFDMLYEKINKNEHANDSNEKENVDSVHGVPEIIKIICKTLSQILTESLDELKLPVNIKKILIKLKKVLKIKTNGENKNDQKKGEFETSESKTTESKTTESTEE